MKIYTSLIDGVKTINEELNFKENIVNNPDFIDIETCYLTGTLEIKNEQLYTNFNVKVKLILASSRSLEPVEHSLDFKLELVFGTGSDSDYPMENEIDFDGIVYGHILSEKPLAIYLDSETPIDKPKVTNPAFSDLKDWNI